MVKGQTETKLVVNQIQHIKSGDFCKINIGVTSEDTPIKTFNIKTDYQIRLKEHIYHLFYFILGKGIVFVIFKGIYHTDSKTHKMRVVPASDFGGASLCFRVENQDVFAFQFLFYIFFVYTGFNKF